jgi:hypothetical protein
MEDGTLLDKMNDRKLPGHGPRSSLFSAVSTTGFRSSVGEHAEHRRGGFGQLRCSGTGFFSLGQVSCVYPPRNSRSGSKEPHVVRESQFGLILRCPCFALLIYSTGFLHGHISLFLSRMSVAVAVQSQCVLFAVTLGWRIELLLKTVVVRN